MHFNDMQIIYYPHHCGCVEVVLLYSSLSIGGLRHKHLHTDYCITFSNYFDCPAGLVIHQENSFLSNMMLMLTKARQVIVSLSTTTNTE